MTEPKLRAILDEIHHLLSDALHHPHQTDEERTNAIQRAHALPSRPAWYGPQRAPNFKDRGNLTPIGNSPIEALYSPVEARKPLLRTQHRMGLSSLIEPSVAVAKKCSCK